MGIQDRDYYRNEGPSIFDSLMPRGVVCRWLIGINIAVFFLQLVAQSAPHGQGAGVVTDWLVLNVDAVVHGQVWRLLTFAFLHDPNYQHYFLHIIFNMLFLWWFGSDVEQLYGQKEFLAIYLTSAFLGGVTYEVWALATGAHADCLGASGAVTTMLILCALHYPRRIVYVYILPMPIWLFAIANVLRDVFGVLGLGETGVACCVHLAGAAFAVAYYKWQRSFVEILRGMMWWKHSRARVRLKLFNPEIDKEPEPVAVSANSAPAIAMDEHLEAKLDAVLAKIAKTGKESLTPKEQEILKQAAEMYKRRRT